MEDIPGIVKALNSLFGKKWGKGLGRTIVILILISLLGAAIAALRPLIGDAYSAIRDFVGQSTLASRIALALISTLISLIAMASVSLALAIIVAIPIRIGLATIINTRIDRVLSALDSLSKGILRIQPDNTTAQQISKDITTLNREWSASRITRFTRWWMKTGRRTQTKPKKTQRKIRKVRGS